MNSKLQSLISELISLPMPTIAAITGHASAAGMIFALSHDYVLMRKDRGFLYMSELDVGLVLPDWFMVVLKCKIGDAKVRGEIAMRAAKLTAEMAVSGGILHSAHDSAEETFEAAVRLGEELAKREWDGSIYGKNRMVVLSEILEKIRIDQTLEAEINSRSKL
uniref:Uncharacterized protein MANES_10G032900 n=1 Tax=Rhizophora mucronata TaxID=61149 RepID=A0A2P2PR97_RHIMU